MNQMYKQDLDIGDADSFKQHPIALSIIKNRRRHFQDTPNRARSLARRIVRNIQQIPSEDLLSSEFSSSPLIRHLILSHQ
jgi:hypothetical protein